MDTKTRLLMKSFTWQLAGLFSMMLIGYLFTNSFTQSGGIAIAGMLTGFFSYFVHELAWSKVGWGKRAVSQAALTQSAGRAVPFKP